MFRWWTNFSGAKYPAVAALISRTAAADPAHRKLFIRGLSFDTSSETLLAAFLPYGEIEEGSVVPDKASGKLLALSCIRCRDRGEQRALLCAAEIYTGPF